MYTHHETKDAMLYVTMKFFPRMNIIFSKHEIKKEMYKGNESILV